MTSKRDSLMGRTAFCFPGQLQERPTLKEDHPLRRDPHFKEWVERASHQTPFNLPDFSYKGEETGFNLKLQIATYLLSMVHFYRLRSEGWVPDVITEHSMGIYAALAASEAITFEKGIEKAIDLALSKKAISATRLTFNIGLHSPRLSFLSGEIRALLKEIEIRS